jgi:hypothetical protein
LDKTEQFNGFPDQDFQIKDVDHVCKIGTKFYISWKEIVEHCVVTREKKEVKVYFKNGRLIDGWFEFRGEPVNVPFRPWLLAKTYDLRDWPEDELFEDALKRFQQFKIDNGL